MTTWPKNPLSDRRSTLYVVAVVVATVSHLVVGYFYLVSGLAAPLLAVTIGLVWWAILATIGVMLASRKSYFFLLVPVIAALSLIASLWFGGTVLGWSA